MLFALLRVVVICLAYPAAASSAGKSTDTDALTSFRLGADAHGHLSSNWTVDAGCADACCRRWMGVSCSVTTGRVVSLSLPWLDLRGPLSPLVALDQIRILDLHGNRINGTLLSLFTSFRNLRLLYLSHNDITGPIPDDFALLSRLVRVDLSDNNLGGPIPSAAVLSNLTFLKTLRIQNNLFSGTLPDYSAVLRQLSEFDASNNALSGSIPEAMLTKFGVGSFRGNAALCGSTPPFPACSSTLKDPPPGPIPSTLVPSNPAASVSSITSSAVPSPPSVAAGGDTRGRLKLGAGTIIGIVVGNGLLLLVIFSALLVCCCYRSGGKSSSVGKHGRRSSGVGDSYVNGDEDKDEQGGAESDGAVSKLVFFDMDRGNGEDDITDRNDDTGRRTSGSSTAIGSDGSNKRWRRFELEELLRASAEMVGKGSLGTVYRAVLQDGQVVAVKRLRDTNPCPRRDFHRYMDLIGRLEHFNLVSLRAFYYAQQEKLLIYDYLPNGALHARLHGNRGIPGRIPLDWSVRIAVVLGAARGLALIHEEYRNSGIPHGNVKSTNILLKEDGVACIADFGLALLLDPAHVIARLGGYTAPEQVATKHLSQEADVYSFGVLVLEVLTGRLPVEGNVPSSLPVWVRSVVREEWTAEVFDMELLRYKDIEEEMVGMLHVGLACTAARPEQRPRMAEVVQMIERIRHDQSPLPEEHCEESTSPSISATAEEDNGRHHRSC